MHTAFHLRRSARCVAIAALLATVLFAGCREAETDVILATTTSTENSGLLDVLVPVFEAQSPYRVTVIAVGSGAALAMGERGDADLLLVHSPAAEVAFMEAGRGIDRTRVMYNDFVIVGPPDDPAGIRRLADALEAMRRIHNSGARFVSRGDDSGTHALEKTLWEASVGTVPRGSPWYAETGQGMAATLTIAAEIEAYAVTDRGTWLTATDHDRLPLLVEGDERLFNVYHVIVVNPSRHAHEINERGALAFRAFLTDPETQEAIGRFGVEDHGQPLFVPYAEIGE